MVVEKSPEPNVDSLESAMGWFPTARFRLLNWANSAENKFLTIMRLSALVIAGLLLLGAIGFFLFGLIQQFGTERVDPAPVSIKAIDVTPPNQIAEEAIIPSEAAKTAPRLSPVVRKQTIALYLSKFKKYQRSGMKIEDGKIIEAVWATELIERFSLLPGSDLINAQGEPLASQEALSLDALKVVGEAEAAADFQKSLIAFRDAKKSQVCTTVTKQKQESVSGWDSYATHCEGWYYSPVGCSTTRTIDVPYDAKVCEMKYPDTLESPAQALGSAVRRYADRIASGRTQAAIAADAETGRIKARKFEGRDRMMQSGQLFLGFLAIMFLYLFIVIERHHRSLRALIRKD